MTSGLKGLKHGMLCSGLISSTDMNAQEPQIRRKIWRRFTDAKYNACYISIYTERLESNERKLEFAIAFGTTASVSAWAIWQTFPWIWTVCVGIAQLCIFVKPHFPHIRNIKRLHIWRNELERIAFDYEILWDSYESGTAKDPDGKMRIIKENAFKIKQKYSDIFLANSSVISELASNRRDFEIKSVIPN